MLIQEPVQAAIWHCLNHYDYNDATFLAERLAAEVNTEESYFLLATCYYRSGKPAQAYDLLQRKGAESPQCKFLLAKCCLGLHKLPEAENILSAKESWERKHNPVPEGQVPLDEVVKEFGDLACFALQLLARICSQTKRQARAAEAYRKSLHLNPFLWASFEELCAQGEKPDPAKTFELGHVENFSTCVGSTQMVAVCQPLNTASSSLSSTAPEFCTPSDANILASTPVFPLSGSALATPLDHTPVHSGGAGIVMGAPLAPTTRKGLRGRVLNNFGTHSLSPLTPSFGVMPSLDDSVMSLLDTSGVRPIPTATPIMSLSMFVAKSEQRSSPKRVLSRQKQDSPLQQTKALFNQSGNTPLATPPTSLPTVTPPAPASAQPPPLQPSVRRSSRLFSNNSCSVKENNKSPNRNKFVTPKSPSRKSKSKLAKTSTLTSKGNTNYDELNEKNREDSSIPATETITSASDLITGNSTGSMPMSPECVTKLQKQSAEGLMALLAQLGAAYQALAQYECRTAVQRLRALPHNHYNTGWALCMEGKAYYELAEYQDSVRAFEECRRMEPARLQGMDILSTALWYLEREVALSLLSQELLLIDRLAVETWCVAGNCFSQQKEHDTAIKFFQRAIQVNPDFAYAYSLLGHEYVQTEELDKAMSCFRAALRLDQRLYNAWLGIGSIFHKQERYPLAEVHFKRALSINPNSSVIMCYMAVTLASLHKTEKALQLLNSAIAVQPKNAVCRFNRARILFTSERYQEALEELEELKEIVPKESQVYFLAGKVHSKLGNTHLELMHFSWMMDLDPKGANSQIKEAMEPALSRSMTGVSTTNSEEMNGQVDAAGSSLGALAADPLSSSLQEAVAFDFNSPQVHDSDESL